MFDAIIRIKRSSTKPIILKSILIEPRTPTQLSKEMKKHRASISQSLLDLKKDGFVECLTKKGINFHYYKTTAKGKKALNLFEKL